MTKKLAGEAAGDGRVGNGRWAMNVGRRRAGGEGQRRLPRHGTYTGLLRRFGSVYFFLIFCFFSSLNSFNLLSLKSIEATYMFR